MEAVENSWRSVGEILVERGLVSEADLEEAAAEEAETGRRVADILVRRGLVTGHDVTSALMEQFTGFPAPDGGEEHDASQPPAEHEPEAAHEIESEPEPEPEFEPEPEPEFELEPPPAFELAAVPDPEPEAQPEHEDVDVPEHGAAHEPEAPVAAYEDLPVQPRALIREADARRLAAESKLAALGHIWQSLEQIHDDLEAHELCTLPFAHELESTQARLTAQGDALSAEISLLKQAREQIESTAHELEQLRTELRDKVHHLAELRATASIWTTRVDNQQAEVEALTTRANTAASILTAFAETRLDAPALEAVTRQLGHEDELAPPGPEPEPQAEAVDEYEPEPANDYELQPVADYEPAIEYEYHADPEPVSEHEPEPDATHEPDSEPAGATDGGYVLLLPREDGPELIERDGWPPAVGETVGVGEESWVVTKIGRSPLPFDDRDCVFLGGSPEEGR